MNYEHESGHEIVALSATASNGSVSHPKTGKILGLEMILTNIYDKVLSRNIIYATNALFSEKACEEGLAFIKVKPTTKSNPTICI
jgi:hypothetical protein